MSTMLKEVQTSYDYKIVRPSQIQRMRKIVLKLANDNKESYKKTEEDLFMSELSSQLDKIDAALEDLKLF